MASPRAMQVAAPAVVEGPICLHTAAPSAMAVGPDGRLLVTGDVSGRLCFCDLEAGRRIGELQLEHPVHAVATTSGVAWVAAGPQIHRVHGFGVRVVGTSTMEAPAVSVAVSPDGMWALGVSSLGEVVLWRTATGREKRRDRFPGAVDAGFTRDGRAVWIQGGDGVQRRTLPGWQLHERAAEVVDAPWATRARGDGDMTLRHPSGEADLHASPQGIVEVRPVAK